MFYNFFFGLSLSKQAETKKYSAVASWYCFHRRDRAIDRENNLLYAFITACLIELCLFWIAIWWWWHFDSAISSLIGFGVLLAPMQLLSSLVLVSRKHIQRVNNDRDTQRERKREKKERWNKWLSPNRKWREKKRRNGISIVSNAACIHWTSYRQPCTSSWHGKRWAGNEKRFT